MRALGCDLPIIPGIMPITSFRQIQRFAELSGAALPRAVTDRINAVADDDEQVRQVGIAIATELSEKLLAGGAPGPALLHPEPIPGYPRDLRQSAPGAASSVISRWVGRVSAT